VKGVWLAVALGLAAVGGVAIAQTARQPDSEIVSRYVPLASGVPGVLYEPAAPGPKSAIGIFLMHSGADYLNHSACTQMSQRGYRVLCANNSNGKGGTFEDGQLDRVLTEAKLGVAYLRSLPGLTKVMLLGHSGGATVMSAYQMIAEGGVATCRGPAKIFQCSDAVAGLPKADGVMLVDANWGLGIMTLLSTDPAIVDENDAKKLDPALDLYSPANGFKPEGSRYNQAFTDRFQKAQGARYARIVAAAQARLKVIEAGKGRFADDEPFTVPGAVLLGFNNKLYPQDVRLFARTKRAWPLIKADGTVVTQIVPTVRQPGNRETATPMMRAAVKTTVRNFLNTYAVRVTPAYRYGADGIEGVDWTSSYASVPGNVSGISVPLLAMGMTGGSEFLTTETIYEMSKSADKTIAFVEGATHVYTPCKACERVPGQYGDTVKTTYDYIDGWLSKPGRFLNR
jgi:pimeloyl-ACP methyl ester carboxylesterase